MRVLVVCWGALLCGCTASVSGLPERIEQATFAPTAICTALIMQQNASLQQLKDALVH